MNSGRCTGPPASVWVSADPVGGEHVPHVRERGLDARQHEQERERRPRHAPARPMRSSQPMTGKSRVMLRDSIRKSPMVISTMMMTSAATSDVGIRPAAGRADHLGHRQRDELEVDEAAEQATTSTKPAMEN